jgi:DNA-directed RNA polymerase subunit M/transcription elongation factor TFIIS
MFAYVPTPSSKDGIAVTSTSTKLKRCQVSDNVSAPIQDFVDYVSQIETQSSESASTKHPGPRSRTRNKAKRKRAIAAAIPEELVANSISRDELCSRIQTLVTKVGISAPEDVRTACEKPYAEFVRDYVPDLFRVYQNIEDEQNQIDAIVKDTETRIDSVAERGAGVSGRMDCPKCKLDTLRFIGEKHTRLGLDEGSTFFYTCSNCGYSMRRG